MRPLSGINVVEAASYISAPFAAQILGDLGATVTKVEPAGKGDPYRRFGARYGDSSLFFKATNQNKSSAFLDLKDESGFASFKDLLREADLLITNWRPSVAPRLGLTEEVVRSEFPQLIWIRVSGFGQDGPKADMPAYDAIIQARSGANRLTDGEPTRSVSLLADKISAMTAAQTATAALIERDRSGTGSICDIAMIDALAYFNSPDIAAGHRLVDAEPDASVIDFLSANAPYQTSDGWLTLSPVSGAQMRSALGVVGEGDIWEELIAHVGGEGFYNGFNDAVRPHLLTQTSAHWEEQFRLADVPATAVMTFSEHMADEQIAHNGTYEVIEEAETGRWRRARWPALMDGTPVETDGLPSPSLDQPALINPH